MYGRRIALGQAEPGSVRPDSPIIDSRRRDLACAGPDVTQRALPLRTTGPCPRSSGWSRCRCPDSRGKHGCLCSKLVTRLFSAYYPTVSGG